LNVALVIIDSLRRDHVGAYGNGWIKTPNLDALAKEPKRGLSNTPKVDLAARRRTKWAEKSLLGALWGYAIDVSETFQTVS
jgi:hypothetical protein